MLQHNFVMIIKNSCSCKDDVADTFVVEASDDDEENSIHTWALD